MIENLKCIRLFVAVYEERSFTAAAKRENATQSGVSQNIRKLEDRLNVSLFSRARGCITVTPAADAFYQRCIEVLRAHAEANTTVARFAKGLSGEIRVGLIPIVARAVLAPALQRFTEQHGNVTVRAVEGYSRVLMQQVRAGAFDFAIVPAPHRSIPGLKVQPFLSTAETLVSSASSAREPLAPIRLADQNALKIVLPAETNTRRVALDSYFAANGVAFDRIVELDAMMGTLDYVASTDWVTILPGIMISAEMKLRTFVVNPLVDPPLLLDLVVVEPARKIMTPAARTFFEMLFEEAARVKAESDVYLKLSPHSAADKRAS